MSTQTTTVPKVSTHIQEGPPPGPSGYFQQDILASLVVFLVALPLCMGIAIASGAPPAAGLVTGIIGGLIVGSLSGCPLQVSGPAAGLAVLVYEMIQKFGMEMLAPVIVLAGAMQLLAGSLRMGQLFRSIGPAVIYGMLAGIGILIVGAQFHVMVDDKPGASGIQNLISIPGSFYKGIFPPDGSSHHLAAFLGVTTILVVILWGRFAPAKLKWIPGALLGVVTATAIAQALGMPVRYVSLPDNLFGAIQLPAAASFLRAFQPEFLLAAVTLAFVASAETLLSASAVDQMHDGPRTNYDKEMRSQGVGNILSGLAGGLPMTGVIVRSATNVAAGAKTRRSAMMHGLWLLILVAALPGVLRLVPTSSLAAILVYTGYKLINPANVRRLISYGGAPVLIYAVTVVMIVCADLLTGIIAGIALSLVKILWALSSLTIETRTSEANRVDLFISGAATFLRMPKLVDTLNALPASSEVHVHFQNMQYIDHASMEAITSWEQQRASKDGKTVVEWEDLKDRYKLRNRFGPLGTGNLDLARGNVSAH